MTWYTNSAIAASVIMS